MNLWWSMLLESDRSCIAVAFIWHWQHSPLPVSHTARISCICWNDCFRHIFGFKRPESVKLLQFYCNELPFEFMYDLFKWKFISLLVGLACEMSPTDVLGYFMWSITLVIFCEKYGFVTSAIRLFLVL